jgi:glutamate synthase domain-containing protein 1
MICFRCHREHFGSFAACARCRDKYAARERIRFRVGKCSEPRTCKHCHQTFEAVGRSKTKTCLSCRKKPGMPRVVQTKAIKEVPQTTIVKRDDLTDAQIERRFRAALKAIKKRGQAA